MAKYQVTLSAEAWVGGNLEIEAESEDEARDKALALAKSGDIVWSYDGVQDDTEEVTAVTKHG